MNFTEQQKQKFQQKTQMAEEYMGMSMTFFFPEGEKNQNGDIFDSIIVRGVPPQVGSIVYFKNIIRPSIEGLNFGHYSDSKWRVRQVDYIVTIAGTSEELLSYGHQYRAEIHLERASI